MEKTSDAPTLVLIVEDDAVVADTLRVYLEQAGFAVDTVTDGVSALTSAST